MELQADPRGLAASQTERETRAGWRGQVPRDLVLIVVGTLLAKALAQLNQLL
jgi:hypothetical protein